MNRHFKIFRMSSGYYSESSSIPGAARQNPMAPWRSFAGFFSLNTIQF